MNITSYLDRIKYNGEPKADLETLRDLQYQHVFNIPFEDVDIYYGIPIMLSTTSFYHKMVEGTRGGYCYELNGLFYELLKALGFKVSMISGRVANGNTYGAAFDHMALLVAIDGKDWLVDVGYGDFSLAPIALEPGITQNDGRCDYRIIDNVVVDGKIYRAVEKWNSVKKCFAAEYIFTPKARMLSDFSVRHHYHQTSSSSRFVRNLMCTLPTENGRLSIVNNKLIKTIGSEKQATLINNTEYKFRLMKCYFGIEVSLPSLMAVSR